MTENFRRWGIELQGHAETLKKWRRDFTAPNDPFIEEIQIGNSSGIILRSKKFSSQKVTIDIAAEGDSIIQKLNAIDALEGSSNLVINRAVIEFDQSGNFKCRHVFASAKAVIGVRMKVGAGVKVIRTSSSGDESGQEFIPQVIEESAKHRLLRAADTCNDISRALDHVKERTDWVQLYKAYEALEGLPCGSITRKQKECFRRTANNPHRHDQKNNQPPINPKNTMSIEEGRGMIREWLRVACDHVLRDER